MYCYSFLVGGAAAPCFWKMDVCAATFANSTANIRSKSGNVSKCPFSLSEFNNLKMLLNGS